MNDLDQKIQAALARGRVSPPDGAALSEELLQTFRGRHRWVSLFGFVLTLAAFAGAVWAAWRLHSAGDTAAQIQFATLAVILVIFVMGLKIWFWMEMHTNRVLREVKRVELLLVSTLPPK